MRSLIRIPLFIIFLFSLTTQISAFEIKTDPQYVVMNFATINELNWAAPEHEWITMIKPQILKQVLEMRKSLEPQGALSSRTKLLAWSTLMEYMNFPLDIASSSSPYAIKMKRILEISDEQNLPVFIPLNGFQWWDHLPELYNWWDPDGTHTDPRFFARQKNPKEFKERFIKGYNPENKWNVQWQNWNTPMKLNYRNWGGGGFRLAPPPALSNPQITHLSYQSVLKERLSVILEQVIPFLEKWDKENRHDLFAGISIGTEISLNASILPSDEFEPYGYRDIQNMLCPVDQPTCGTTQRFSHTQIDVARRQSVNQYLITLTRFATRHAIPKQRIYTHTWSEAVPGERRYTNYADSTTTLYARPGLSFYGYADNPLNLPDWSQTLKTNGQPAWGAIEYSAGTSASQWKQGLENTFNNSHNPAKIMVIYNWQEQKSTGAVPAIRTFLQQEPKTTACTLPEIISTHSFVSQNPQTLSWRYVGNLPTDASLTLFIKQGIKTSNASANIHTQKISSEATSVTTPFLPYGNYSWFIEVSGCQTKRNTSQPKILLRLPTPSNTTPAWVTWILDTILK